MSLFTPAIRRGIGIGAAIGVAFAVVGLTAPTASADPSTTNVILTGTTDVSDSGLFSQVIQPDFEAAYPQYTVSYVPLGSGAAISNAEGGSADALIVHAASLENQFVASGYSTEKYGRSIFWGDYVLLGPASDPAGVKADGSHDIAAAFKDVATAGAAGNAFFVSRGGTPGTVVQEHAIWALTSGVPTCTVSAANGGGVTPSTTSGACPSTTPPIPAWYLQASASQSVNVHTADVCAAGNNDCYVFTDRGTYEYMKSLNEINNLTILTQTNSTKAPGGINALVNSFHAYAVNPNSPGFASNPNIHLNTAGAKALLDWMTSSTGQGQIGDFLQQGSVKTFVPTASPNLSASTPPGSVDAGQSFYVVGQLSNVTPGYPALSGQTVSLNAVPDATPSATPKVVATAKTTSSGTYLFDYKPTADATYTVTTSTITKVENSSLNPVFGDILQPASADVGDVTVTAPTATINSITVGKSNVATFVVTFSPEASGTKDTLKLYGRHNGSPSSNLTAHKVVKLKSGATTVTFTYSLGKPKAGKTLTWSLEAVYVQPGAPSAKSAVQTVTVH